MLRNFTSFQPAPVLLFFVFVLAVLVPVSSSATFYGDGGKSPQSTGGDPNHSNSAQDLVISMGSQWGETIPFDWTKQIISTLRLLDTAEDSAAHSFSTSRHKAESKIQSSSLRKKSVYKKKYRFRSSRNKHKDGSRTKRKKWYDPADRATTPTPEPSTAVLMLLGLAGLAGFTRRLRP
jgi:hypothetical protein